MIGFQDQEISFAEMMLYKLWEIAKVGDDYNFDPIRAEAIADRVGGIVRDHKRLDIDVANLKSLARADVLHTLDLLSRTIGQHFQDFAMRGLRQIRGTLPFALHLPEAARMVAVLVGDEDAVH